MVQPHARSQAEFGNEAVIAARKAHGILGAIENEKEAVAAVDLVAVVLREQPPCTTVMLGPERCGTRIAQSLDQRGAVDQIGEEQGVLAHGARSRRR
jgi:hypothetical protein